MTVDDRTDTTEVLLREPSTTSLRPRYEGSNICSWIGFKHVNYLVEEAVLAHFRNAGYGARTLFEDYGLDLDLVDLDSGIRTAFHIDDAVVAEVVPLPTDAEPGLRFAVTLRVERERGLVKAVASKVRVVLRTDPQGGPAISPPDQLRPAITDRIRGDATAIPQPSPGDEPLLQRLVKGRNAFAWKWRMPYMYCHFTERVQMSGYLRQLEEVVDLFLASRGISIKTLLDERRWIPVVPHSAIRLHDEALMEEDLYTVFTVENIFKSLTYTARADWYVDRSGVLVPTASGTITHGYAVIENRRDWRLADFDARMLAALRGETLGACSPVTGAAADGAGRWASS